MISTGKKRKKMKRVWGRFRSEIRSWHVGLPNPPGTPEWSWKLMGRAWREGNKMYWAGLGDFYGGVWRWIRQRGQQEQNNTALLEKREEEETKMEREVDRAAKEMGEAVRSTRENAPEMFKRLVVPQLVLFTQVLREFSRGFKEG